MEPGGFLDTRKHNPIGLGLIIAAHGAVLTAIALAPPETFNKITFLPLIAKTIPDTPVPAETTPLPKPKAAQPSQIDIAKPLISANSNAEPVFAKTVDPLPDPMATGSVEPTKPMTIEPVFVQAAIDPRVAGRFQPDYPLSLIRAGIEGTATVRILIGSDGVVKQVEMVSATDPGFFEATRKQALRTWRFRAATRDGVATESWRTMTVRFHIDG